MDIYHTIIRPLITEKSTKQSQVVGDREAKDKNKSKKKIEKAPSKEKAARGAAYAFAVHADANKAQIRDAIEKIYGVKVRSVRTSTHKGKARRFKQHMGQAHITKKAVVVLDVKSTIDLF